MRDADTEMTVVMKTYAQTPGDGKHTTRHRATWGSNRMAQEAGGRKQESKGKVGVRALIVIFAGRNG